MTLRLFPALPGIVYPVKRSPIWSTDVQQSVSGKVTTLGHWSYPLYSFEVGYEFLRMDTAFLEYQELVAFFNLAGGRRDLFRFNDPIDNSVTLQAFGVGDGTTTQFQLVRTLQGATLGWVDPVWYPVTAAIYVDGFLKVLGVDYTISTTGLVTFASPPALAAALAWTGTFNWLVRFSEDSSTFEQFTYNLQENGKLLFTSEKV